MKFIPSKIDGVFLIELEKRGDQRGFFSRMFCAEEFASAGLESRFVQANTSFSAESATLRGMHYQRAPHAEAKLVKCVAGALYDVALDLRPDSPSFGKYQAFELTSQNRSMVYIPKGCAHGFMTLLPNSEIMYLVSANYAPEAEDGVRYDDPAFGIEWPLTPSQISAKDISYKNYERM